MRLIITLLLLLASEYYCLAQHSAAAQAATVRYPSLLWRVTHPNIADTSYLYGTIHVTDARVFEFGDSVLPCLYRCEAIATEIKMNGVDYFGMIRVFLMRDTTLKQLYSPDDYQHVKKYLRETMGPLSIMFNLDKIKPFFLATMAQQMGEKDSLAGNTIRKKQALDMYLADLGKRNGLTDLGIETIDEQLAALDRIPLLEQAQMLLTLTHGDKDMMGMEELITYYMQQNIDALLAYYQQHEGNDHSSFDQSLVVERNQVMAHRMDSIVRQQPTFMAVGTLHLPGIIELLRQQGFVLTPVVSSYSGNGVYYKTKGKLFQNEDDGFEVILPEYPSIAHNDYDTIKSVLFYYDDTDNDLYYSLTQFASSDSLNNAINAELLNNRYQTILAELMQNAQWKIVKSEPHTLANGKPAYKGELHITDLNGKSNRFLLIFGAKKIFLLSAIGTSGKVNNIAVDTFFNSFRFID